MLVYSLLVHQAPVQAMVPCAIVNTMVTLAPGHATRAGRQAALGSARSWPAGRLALGRDTAAAAEPSTGDMASAGFSRPGGSLTESIDEPGVIANYVSAATT